MFECQCEFCECGNSVGEFVNVYVIGDEVYVFCKWCDVKAENHN